MRLKKAYWPNMSRFLTYLLILIAFSCTKVNKSDIPYARVYLELDLRYEDKELVGLYNHKEFTSPRKAGEAIGYSGVLVVCGGDDVYYAYELCCPNEAERSTQIVPTQAGTAKCTKCETEYDTGFGTGAPTKGPSKHALQKYNVVSFGQRLIVQY